MSLAPDDDARDLQEDLDSIARVPAVPAILDVVCRTTGMGFAAIARVTEGRWVACATKDDIGFGLKPGGELKVETTLCHTVRQMKEAVVIDHVAEDTLYGGHVTPATYGFQSYISVPIILVDGTFFGTLCAIDPKPARLNNAETIGMFRLFAELLGFHIDAHRRIASAETSLLGERRTAELREQFIAVLGHDLRNPLASIDAGTRLLGRTPLNETAAGLLVMVQQSVGRMAKLIDDVLDFARGRLGNGLTLSRQRCDIEPVIVQVVSELQTGQPGRVINMDLRLTETVDCDPTRIGQLASNLLANALTHGLADRPVRLTATMADSRFTLSVSNQGAAIPQAALDRLFLPFERGAVRPNQQGLGLGLYIASEVARAHGGVLEAASTPAETRFTFTMALR